MIREMTLGQYYKADSILQSDRYAAAGLHLQPARQARQDAC